MAFHHVIQGSTYSDERGALNFFNAFEMNEIVRLYEIAPSDTIGVRGWQGHREEKKWFYCNAGSFIVNLVQLDNFDKPSKAIVPERFVLDAANPSILEISGGYATGFKAASENSKLIVFSNFSLKESKNDDYRYPPDYWAGQW